MIKNNLENSSQMVLFEGAVVDESAMRMRVVLENDELSVIISYKLKGSNHLYPKEASDKRLKTETLMKNGLNAKIIDYVSRENITIEFEDGCIVHNKRYGPFIDGRIAHPTLKSAGKQRGYLFGLEVRGIAYQVKGVTNYYCHCPKCDEISIMDTKEMREHKCGEIIKGD